MPEQKGEKLNAFVSRYMGSGEAKSLPDQKPRAAEAYSEFRRRKKRK